jgi:hypothetical protein
MMSTALKISVLVFFCLFSTAAADTSSFDPDSAGLSDIQESTFVPYTSSVVIRQSVVKPVVRTFSLGLGPEIIRLKTSYLQEREESNAFSGSSPDAKVGYYFDLLATSSPLSSKLIGEGEVAYSTLGFSTVGEQRPTMSRLGLKGHWGSMSYGADYKSFGRGFASPSGFRIDHDRDESQLWGQYNLGFLRVKGAIGEVWETNSDTNQLSLTRTAATSLNFSKSSWNALLSSSYSIIGQEESSKQKTVTVTNGVVISYRPVSVLTIEPNLSFKEEWDRSTGIRTETPSAGLMLISTPLRDLQLTGRASYARGISEDRLKDASTINTGASLNWKIGKSLMGEQFLSFQLEYKNELFPNSPSNSQEHFGGMLQLKIVGF